MFIPADRIYKEMISEEGSIWFVPSIGDDDVAILVKAPSVSLKAVINGSDVEIIAGINLVENVKYLCTGLKIYDTINSPIFFYGVQRNTEEHDALNSILMKGSVPIFLFNEMNINVASSKAFLAKEGIIKANELIGDLPKIYVGDFTDTAIHCLDCFEFTLTENKQNDKAHKIDIVSIHLTCEPWIKVQSYFLGEHEANKYDIMTELEGEAQENIVWFSLESAFGTNLYKNPQILFKNKLREFTDIFAFYERGLFLIESKVESVNEDIAGRTSERKIANIKKHIKKAIKQLRGASDALKEGWKITDKKMQELMFRRDTVPHCIVLISELFYSGDWSDVEEVVIDAFLKTEAFFHILDLREFARIISACSGKPELIDANLLGRFKVFVKTRSLNIRSRIPPEKQ